MLTVTLLAIHGPSFNSDNNGNCYNIDTEQIRYVAVTQRGKLRDAIARYNDEVGKVRELLVEKLSEDSVLRNCFNSSNTRPPRKVTGRGKEFLNASKYDPKVITVVLMAEVDTLDDPASYGLLRNYFTPTFDLSKCSIWEDTKFDPEKPFWDPLPRSPFPRTLGEPFDCQRATSMGGHLDYRVANKHSASLKSLRMDPDHLAHVDIIRGGIVEFESGNTCTGNVLILPDQCNNEGSSVKVVCSGKKEKLEFYDEVFVISQNWGRLPQHNTMENLARIALLRDSWRRTMKSRFISSIRKKPRKFWTSTGYRGRG